MARKKIDVEKELARIEQEERAIFAEEKEIGRKEDLVTTFEELGLMRWKSYYILTTGAILLLALTFVTSLWVMHDQITDLQQEVNLISVGVDQTAAQIESGMNNLSATIEDLKQEIDSIGSES